MLWPVLIAAPLLVVAALVAASWVRHRPVRFPRPEDVDLDAEHARVRAVLDSPSARRLVAEQDGVRVYRCRTDYCPYVGYLSESVIAAEAEEIRAFVHERAPITKINEAYDGGRALGERPDGGEVALYGTMRFRSQSPLTAPRDGVAITSVRRRDGGEIGVLTLSVDHPDAPPLPGYARYRNYASYDRITPLGDGRCRLEHIMVLDPNGWILPFFWNLFLTRPNARIYLSEARSLRRLLEVKP
ncbi:MAG TPA: START domain-containing protein [Candidatus Nanopelagicales bacterium]|nr:START domain-containing protein [Candidatus Nanopelagicales bacterium]